MHPSARSGFLVFSSWTGWRCILELWGCRRLSRIGNVQKRRIMERQFAKPLYSWLDSVEPQLDPYPRPPVTDGNAATHITGLHKFKSLLSNPVRTESYLWTVRHCSTSRRLPSAPDFRTRTKYQCLVCCRTNTFPPRILAITIVGFSWKTTLLYWLKTGEATDTTSYGYSIGKVQVPAADALIWAVYSTGFSGSIETFDQVIEGFESKRLEPKTSRKNCTILVWVRPVLFLLLRPSRFL